MQLLPFDLLQGLHVTMAQALAVNGQHTAIHRSRTLQRRHLGSCQLKTLANGVSDGLNITLASCSQKQDASCRQLCCAPVQLKQLQGSTD